MVAERMFDKLNSLLDAGDMGQAEAYLLSLLEQAKAEEDYAAYIVTGNEMIGFYRGIAAFQKAFDVSEDILLLLEELQLDGSEHFAETLLNAAAAYREAGQLRQAYTYYVQAFAIYERTVPETDYRIAALTCDMGLLLQQMEEHEKAGQLLKEAVTLYGKMKDNSDKETGYGLSLMGAGEACYRSGDYKESLHYYEKALQEVERQLGKGESYALLCKNCQIVCECMKDEEKAQKYRDAAKKTEQGI